MLLYSNAHFDVAGLTLFVASPCHRRTSSDGQHGNSINHYNEEKKNKPTYENISLFMFTLKTFRQDTGSQRKYKTLLLSQKMKAPNQLHMTAQELL